jgi:hypothetical protein
MPKPQVPKTQGNVAGIKGWQISTGHLLQKAVREKLDSHKLEFLDAMIEVSRTAIDERVRFAALVHLLDRQLGKAPEAIVIDHRMEVKAMVANITPDVQAKLTDVITALRSAKPTESSEVETLGGLIE